MVNTRMLRKKSVQVQMTVEMYVLYYPHVTAL